MAVAGHFLVPFLLSFRDVGTPCILRSFLHYEDWQLCGHRPTRGHDDRGFGAICTLRIAAAE